MILQVVTNIHSVLKHFEFFSFVAAYAERCFMKFPESFAKANKSEKCVKECRMTENRRKPAIIPKAFHR